MPCWLQSGMEAGKRREQEWRAGAQLLWLRSRKEGIPPSRRWRDPSWRRRPTPLVTSSLTTHPRQPSHHAPLRISHLPPRVARLLPHSPSSPPLILRHPARHSFPPTYTLRPASSCLPTLPLRATPLNHSSLNDKQGVPHLKATLFVALWLSSIIPRAAPVLRARSPYLWISSLPGHPEQV